MGHPSSSGGIINHRRRSSKIKWAIPIAGLSVALTFGVAAAASGPNDFNGQYFGDQPFNSQNHNYQNFFSNTQFSFLTAPLTNDPQCTLTVPANPLSAQGLATPYVLGSTAGTVCTESNQDTAAFVQAVILNPATGQVSAYNPVVEDATTPATPPPVPVLPPNAVVGIWTGFNDNILKLVGPGSSSFVNFAQQSYANSPQLFAALFRATSSGMLTVPPLGTSTTDGQTCPSIRDFSIVDQDQSDNVPVSYGAPFNVSNGSDDQLITNVNAAIGCTQWQVPLLSSPGQMTTTGPTDEVQAAYDQPAPAALVPAGDEFTTSNGQFLPPLGTGQPDLFIRDLYRAQVGQGPTFNNNDTTAYCQNLASVGEPRLATDATAESGFPAPSFAQIGTNLALVMANRFFATWTNLNCPTLTGKTSPITVTVNGAGVATAAAYGVSMPFVPTPPPPPVGHHNHHFG